MAIKKVNGVIVPRNDTAENWAKAINFTPKKGELIIFNADKSSYDSTVEINGQSYPVKSSDKVRFKFGDGETNVNALPFATTENSGGEIDEKWLKDYISKYTGAIVYLNTKQSIGRTLELQDVYPIQSVDTKLQIISKNRIIYNPYSEILNGVNININNDEGVKVTGNATDSIDKYITVGSVNITTPGKYTISVDNNGVLNSNKQCYMNYILHDSNGQGLISLTKLTKDSPVVIDSRELNCTHIDITLRLTALSGESFNTSAAQTFHVQVEYGEVATPYTPPKDETNVGNKTINIYGKNLYNGPTSISWPGEYIEINSIRTNIDTKPSLHYIKGVMTEDNNITMSGSHGTQTISTPLLKGDKFTLTYSYNTGHIINTQILYGHVDYTEYEPYWIETTTSESNGTCDISNIKYPYSFLALETVAVNDGYAIYLSYDPALSRNWTEKQLSDLNKRIDTLESIIKSLTN